MSINMTFTDFVTPIPADWLNNVNSVVNAFNITTPTRTVPSIAALRLVNHLINTNAFVTGYYAAGDGGGGNYFYDSTDVSSSDNGGTIIVAVDGARWKLTQAAQVTVRQFGAKGNGTTDDTVAVQAALTWAMAQQVSMRFPSGHYHFTAPLTVTFPAQLSTFTIIGDGPDLSILNWASGNGLTINYLGPQNSSNILTMSFTTSATNSGVGLKFNQTALSDPNPALNALSNIREVVFRGNDGYIVTACWATAFVSEGVSNVDLYSCYFGGNAALGGSGTGVLLEGTASLPPVVFNMVSCNFEWNLVGIQYGNYVQGVSITTTNFVGGSHGVLSAASLTNLDQLTVTSSQFNQALDNIVTQTNIANTMLIGNEVIVQSNASGFLLNAAGIYTIVGNTLAGNGFTNTNGIVINNSTGAGVITGNMLFGLTTAIFLQTGSNGVNVQSNAYTSNSNNVINLGFGNTVGGGSP